MTFHGYGGSWSSKGKGEQRLCVCGFRTGWGNARQTDYEWKRHIDQAAAIVHYEPPSMQELLERSRTNNLSSGDE